MHNLKIHLINVNSIISLDKRHYLDLHLKTHKPDVVLITETKLNRKYNPSFKNYILYRNDRTDRIGGGTAILVKHSIHTEHIPNPNLTTLEVTIIKIKVANRPTYIMALYNRTGLVEFNTTDLNTLLNITNNNNIILGGDFNAKHPHWNLNSNTTNKAGTSLYDWYLNNHTNYNIKLESTDLPTYNRQDSESYLDLFFISNNLDIRYNPNNPDKLKTLDFPSDHKVVELILNNTNVQLTDPKLIYNYSNTNWLLFNSTLNNKVDNIAIPDNRNITIQEADLILEELEEAFREATERSIPKCEMKQKGCIPLPWNILNLIKHKKLLRRKWYNIKQNPQSRLIKSQITNLTKIIKDRIYIHHSNYTEKKLASIKMNNNTFKTLKNFCGATKIQKIPNLTNPINPTEQLQNDDEKLNAIGMHFAKIHTLNPDVTPDQIQITNTINNNYNNNHIALTNFSNEFRANLDSNQENTHNANFVSPNNIRDLIKSKNNKKTSGPDNIPNFLLKKTQRKFWIFISILFNQLYNIAYFPDKWKTAHIIPLKKPNKPPFLAASYRPISLLSTLSKLYESILKRNLDIHLDRNNILPDFQMGFRKYHSTNHALTIFQDHVSENLNNKKATLTCSLDLNKAFDTTWIEGLIYKMKNHFNFDDHLCKNIYHYLKNRSFRVKLSDKISDLFQIVAGVPQGSILGPILYNIFVADLPKPTNPLHILCYADDILLFISNFKLLPMQKSLNTYLAKLQKYFSKWKLTPNVDKCQVMITKGKKQDTYPNISRHIKNNNIKVKFNNNLIKFSNRMKYLGINFSQDAQFNKHVQETIIKATTALSSISRIIKPTKSIQSRIKIIVYKQIIRPIITYGFPIWFNISSKQMEKLRTFERKCLRYCINFRRHPGNNYKYISNKTLYEKCKINRIDQKLVTAAIKYLDTLQLNDNPIIEHYNRKLTDTGENIGKYKAPHTIKWLQGRNMLYNNEGKLVYYHQSLINDGHVYNINQPDLI